MNYVAVLCISCTVLAIFSHEATGKPFAPLIAFKKGFLVGLLKGAVLNPERRRGTPTSFSGTASGSVQFSGKVVPSRTRNYQNRRVYGSRYWNGGQLNLRGDIRASGRHYPIVKNGRPTRRKTISGTIAFSANGTAYRQPWIATTASSYPDQPYIAPEESYSTVAAVASDIPIANGHSAAEANIFRSRNGMQYGTGNIHISVANAGSGTGAIIHLGRGSTTVSHTPIRPTTEPEPTSTFDVYSNVNNVQSPSDSYLPPTDDVVLSSDYDNTYGTSFSDDSVTSTYYGPLDTDVQSTTENEIVPIIDYDYDYTTTDVNDDYIYYKTDVYADVTSNDYATTTTTEASRGFEFDFNASGSGSLSTNNGVKAEGNANFDSSFTLGSTNTGGYKADEGMETFTSDDYNYGDATVDDANRDTSSSPAGAYLPPVDATFVGSSYYEGIAETYSTTTEASRGIEFDFSASGSGSLSTNNGVKAEGNANFASSFSLGSTNTGGNKADEDTETFASYDYDYGDATVDDANVRFGFSDYSSPADAYSSPADAYSSPADAYLPPIDDTFVGSSYNEDIAGPYSPTDNTYVNSVYDNNSGVDIYIPPDASYLPPVHSTVTDDTYRNVDGYNEIKINVSVSTTGTTSGSGAPTLVIEGMSKQYYDSYIKTNIEAIITLSDIALLHGRGLPVTIRLRTRHRIRMPHANSGTITITAADRNTAGGGIINLFSDTSKLEVSKAPLLYKYSDVIESPDAVQPSSSPTINEREVPSNDQHSQGFSASAGLNLSFNANADFSRSRSIIGGKRPVEVPSVSQSNTKHSATSENVGKVIANSSNNSNNTTQSNVQNIKPVPGQTRRKQKENNDTRSEGPKNNVVKRLTSNPFQRREQNIRRPPSRTSNTRGDTNQVPRRRLPPVRVNKTRTPTGTVSAKKTSSRHSQTSGNIGQQPSNNHRQPHNIASSQQQNQKSIISSTSRNRNLSFIETLAQFAESHRLSLLKNLRRLRNNRTTSNNSQRRSVANMSRPALNNSESGVWKGRSFSTVPRRYVSSLDRKENSGISRAKLRYIHRDTIPSPSQIYSGGFRPSSRYPVVSN